MLYNRKGGGERGARGKGLGAGSRERGVGSGELGARGKSMG